jgi:hypothetical protein
MFVTTHVAFGAVLGRHARTPAQAFVAGLVSHAVLDMTPHLGWVEGEAGPSYLTAAVIDGSCGLGVMAMLLRRTPRHRRVRVLAGMLGGAFPDLNKPSELFFGRSCFPDVVDRLHIRIQNEAPHRLPHEIAYGTAMVAWAASVVASEPRRRWPRLLLGRVAE